MLRSLLIAGLVAALGAPGCGITTVHLDDGRRYRGRLLDSDADGIRMLTTARADYPNEPYKRTTRSVLAIPERRITRVTRRNPAARGVGIGGSAMALVGFTWFVFAFRDDLGCDDSGFFACVDEEISLVVSSVIMGIGVAAMIPGWVIYEVTTGDREGGATVRLSPTGLSGTF